MEGGVIGGGVVVFGVCCWRMGICVVCVLWRGRRGLGKGFRGQPEEGVARQPDVEGAGCGEAGCAVGRGGGEGGGVVVEAGGLLAVSSSFEL